MVENECCIGLGSWTGSSEYMSLLLLLLLLLLRMHSG